MPKKSFISKHWKAILILIFVVLFVNNNGIDRRAGYIGKVGTGDIIAGQPVSIVFICGTASDTIQSCNVGDQVIVTAEYESTGGNAFYTSDKMNLQYSGVVGKNVQITFTPPMPSAKMIGGTVNMDVSFAVLTGGTWKSDEKLFIVKVPTTDLKNGGQLCDSNSECKSGYCVGGNGLCAYPCNTGDKGYKTCPSGKQYVEAECQNGRWVTIQYPSDRCVTLPVCQPSCDSWSNCDNGQQSRKCKSSNCESYTDTQACSSDSGDNPELPPQDCPLHELVIPQCKQNEVIVSGGVDTNGCRLPTYCKKIDEQRCSQLTDDVKCTYGRAINPNTGCALNKCNPEPSLPFRETDMLMGILLVVIIGGGVIIMAKRKRRRRR